MSLRPLDRCNSDDDDDDDDDDDGGGGGGGGGDQSESMTIPLPRSVRPIIDSLSSRACLHFFSTDSDDAKLRMKRLLRPRGPQDTVGLVGISASRRVSCGQSSCCKLNEMTYEAS